METEFTEEIQNGIYRIQGLAIDIVKKENSAPSQYRKDIEDFYREFGFDPEITTVFEGFLTWAREAVKTEDMVGN